VATSAPNFRELPRASRALIPAVVAAALAALAADLALGGSRELDPLLLGFTAAVCAVASLFEIWAPGHYSFQPNLIPFFCAAVLLPVWSLPLLAILCFAPAALAQRARWYTTAFNVGNYLLAGLAASLLAEASGIPAGPDRFTAGTAALLVAAAAAFVALNHALIVAVVAVSRDRAARSVAREARDALVLDLGLAMSGACAAVLWRYAPELVLLAPGPALLIHRALSVPLLLHKSQTDPKTGLYNSDYLANALEDAVAAARKRGSSVSVAMIDLDHLRAVNNRCGHLAGDRLLRDVAELVQRLVGPAGLAARFGGDELCVVLPEAEGPEAALLAERVREGVSELGPVEDGSGDLMRVTISAGVATFPEHGETATGLLHAADTAVYDAKLGGRDRVRVALPPTARTTLGHESNGSHRTPDLSSSPRDVAPLLAPAAGGAPKERAPGGSNGSNGSAPQPASPAAGGAPRSARLAPWYAGGLVVAAIVAGLLSDFGALVDHPGLLGALIVSVAATDLIRIDVFGRGNVSPATVPSLVLAFFFGPLGPIVAEGLIVSAGAARRRDRLPARAFDFGSLALAGAAAALVLDASDPATPAGVVAVMALAGMTYYAVNMLLVVGMLALTSGKSPAGIWVEQLAWLWPHYLAFGVLAGGFVATEQALGATVFAVFAVPLLIMWVAEKQYLERSRGSVAALRRSHEELERANERLRGLLEDNQELIGRMHRSYLSTITSLARTIEAKDPYTSGHTERVADIARLLAAEVGFDEAQLQAVNVGALIHDIGKIGVPDQVLLKPGRLDDDEFRAIQRHPEISSYIVADLELPAIVKQMVRSHHERFDGAGYPDGLRGEEIPLAARILSVADALDAMTSDRPYRKALPLDDACEEIAAEAGRQFCPQVVGALQACFTRDPGLWGRISAPQSLDAAPPRT
jgi:diguanylate cyclase (GGDEF)-like protein